MSEERLQPSSVAQAEVVGNATFVAGLKSQPFERRARYDLRGIEELLCSQFEMAALSGCDARA